jgi:hypothetical protein
LTNKRKTKHRSQEKKISKETKKSKIWKESMKEDLKNQINLKMTTNNKDQLISKAIMSRTPKFKSNKCKKSNL